MHKTLRVLNFDFITLILQLVFLLIFLLSIFIFSHCNYTTDFYVDDTSQFYRFYNLSFFIFSLRHTDESSSGKSIINTWLLSNILLSLPKWENNKFQNRHHQKEPTSIELLVPWVDNTERVFYYYYFCCKINLWFFLFQI